MNKGHGHLRSGQHVIVQKHIWDQLFTVDTIWNIGETGDINSYSPSKVANEWRNIPLNSKFLFFSANTWKFTSTRRDRNRTCSIFPPPEISEERDKFSRAFWRARPHPTAAGRLTLRADVGAVTRTVKLPLWFPSLKIIWSLLQFSPKTRLDKLILNSDFIRLFQQSNSFEMLQ